MRTSVPRRPASDRRWLSRVREPLLDGEPLRVHALRAFPTGFIENAFWRRSRKEPAPMIEVTALTKRYGSLTVLDGVDFAVQAGEIAAVVGPSGAGKSTLARCINLLEKPTSGSILVDGKDLTRLSRRELRSARRAIGTVFQSAGLLARMTAAENVALPLRFVRLSHGDRQTRVRDLL